MRWRFLFIALIVLAIASGNYRSTAPTGRAAAATNRSMGYGMVGNDYAAIATAGFNWAKIHADWRDLQPYQGAVPNFSGLDSAVNSARSHGLSVMLNVHRSPGWASGSLSATAPPLDDNTLASFMYQLALHFRGRVAAYEIWNEPNLRVEWGQQLPGDRDQDGNWIPNPWRFPVKYASMLRALYPRVKQADPDALVITGGLATAGDGARDWTYGDLLWISHLYLYGNVRGCGADGRQTCFDALGSHPYGGPYWPEVGPTEDNGGPQYTVGMYFRRAEQQKQMIDLWGQDYARGVWVTELNWLINPDNCQWGDEWSRYQLTGTLDQQEADRADYLRRAFSYAYANWPWMLGMLVFNIDLQGGRDVCDPVSAYALTRSDWTRRPAYSALRDMSKPGISAPVLQVSGNLAQFLLSSSGPSSATQRFQLTNTGGGTLGWTATSGGESWLSVSPSSGTAPATLSITVNRGSLSPGWRDGTVTIAGTNSGTQSSPQQIRVRFYVGTVHRQSLPPVVKD